MSILESMPIRSLDVGMLTGRASALAPSLFEPSESENMKCIQMCKVLVVGAGGLGCEILKTLALSGFRNVEVIDMDTIEISNLNRQFLFRKSDVGKSKAEVAAACIRSRIPSCQVIAHNCKIEDKSVDFYADFHLIICGLDSINARLWLNNTLVGMVKLENGQPVGGQRPLIDGGTEGFLGNARVIFPYQTPCVACTIDLYPPRETYPLCTIANTPRLPEHCVEYTRVILWEKEKPFGDTPMDGDNPEHIQWALEKSQERAAEYNIQGVDIRLVQGVIKHIIPAVASTNAVIAAVCVLEAVKMASNLACNLDNYMNFQQEVGASMQVVKLERNPDCIHCGKMWLNRQE